MKNLKRCRTKFGMTGKLAAVVFSAMLMAFPFASCNTDVNGNDPNDKPTSYTVTIATGVENGKVTANPDSAAAGETITLTVTPDSGYELDTLTVKNGEEDVTVTDNAFTMPQSDVTVNATFKKKVTLADIFLNGSVTIIKFTTFNGAVSATFENDNGTFSITSGAVIPPSGDPSGLDPMGYDPGTKGLKTVTQDGNNLTIKYGFPESDSLDTIFTFNKEDNSYSISGSGYFEVSDITALEVNGTDIKNTLTKK